MGNSSSSESADGGPEGSGVTLSANLQKTIVNDFNAKVHAAWMERSTAQKQEEAANSELGKQHQQFMKQHNALNAKLDDRMDALSAKFHDQVYAADYDAARMQEKYVKAEVGCLLHCVDVNFCVQYCALANLNFAFLFICRNPDLKYISPQPIHILSPRPQQILGSGSPCEDVRNNYVSCQKNNNGAVDCEIYVQAIQDCVTKVLGER